jgi:hypothetical protein
MFLTVGVPDGSLGPELIRVDVKRLADGSKVFGCQEKNAFTPLPLGDTST